MAKKLSIAAVVLFALAPFVVSAADWGVSFGSGGFSLGVGSGSGGFGGGGWSLGNIAGFGLPSGSIFGIIANLLLWALAIFGFLGVIGFVISGILYIVAAGDDTKMESAKKAMTYSIIGVIIGLAGVVIIQAIDAALRQYSKF